jgi:hypothetical protein
MLQKVPDCESLEKFRYRDNFVRELLPWSGAQAVAVEVRCSHVWTPAPRLYGSTGHCHVGV